MLSDYYGRRRIGTIFGVSRAVQVAGFALGPLIAALAFDMTLSYSGAFTSFFVLTLVGTGLILAARPPTRNASLN